MPVMDIPPVGVSGQFQAQVVDPQGNQPTNVIRTGELLGIDCRWFIDGALASSLGGQWRLQVVFEGLGTAVEFSGPSTAPVPQAILDGRTGSGSPYTHEFRIPMTNAILGGQSSVLAKVGVALTYIDAANTPGPIAAFVDLGVVQIFRP
jgi:hypothetical protein